VFNIKKNKNSIQIEITNNASELFLSKLKYNTDLLRKKYEKKKDNNTSEQGTDNHIII